jgi:hypothetical protein
LALRSSNARSRSIFPLFALTAAAAFGSSGCKQGIIQNSLGSPEAKLGGQQGATTVVATFPNPCEIDVDFGDVPIGLTDSVTVQITNTGSGALDLSQVNPTLDPEFGLNYGTQQPIQSGEFGQFGATFQPYKVGTVSSSFTIQTDGSNSSCPNGATNATITVKLTGNGIQLSLVVQPNVLDFGNTLLNTTGKKSVMLINKSTAPVSAIMANVVGSDANLFRVDNAPTTLAAGASAAVDISYSPLALETRSIASVVFSGSDGEKATLNLFGEPVGVALTLAPNPINFGYVVLQPVPPAVGCTVVTNQSNVPVTIMGTSEFENEGEAFALATTDDATPPNPFSLPITIQGGDNAKVCFSFAPPISQAYNGQVTLTTNDPSGMNPVVNLTGWGGGPQISCMPLSIAFGQTLDHSITTVPVLCTNTGSPTSTGVNLLIEPPTASPAVFSAQFDESMDTYPLNGLAPGQTAQIDVSYAPTGNSNDKGTLFIKSNGGQGKTIQIPLTGQGLDVPPCQFVVAPSQLNFGNVQVGDTSGVLSFEIQNVGTDVCFIQGLQIKDDASTSFKILTTSIAPDPTTNKITIPGPGSAPSNLTVTLDFSPTAQGQAFTAEAAFSISDPSDPNQVVPLTGTSESTCLVIAPTSLNFGDVGENDAGVLCTSASRTFSIFNECQTAATVQSLTIQSGPGDLVPQFSVPAGPPLPLTIEPSSSAEIYEMFFEPTTLGTHTGQLLISDGTVDTLLPVTGAAVSTGTETDAFTVGPPKADILFIIDVDDDGDEQEQIVMAAPTFFAAAADIDYRIAVTTDNDDAAVATAEFGHLLPCPTCSLQGAVPTIIDPTSKPAGQMKADPATAFANFYGSVPNSQYPTGQPTDEHFFIALYNALQHGPQPGVDFFRPGVFFASIMDNSDNEADSSVLGKGNHNPTWYANFFETYFQNPFLFTWNYINPTQTVTGTGFSNYLQLPPSIQQMISATNGFALNTSDPNWASALTSVWTSAITAHTYYPLVGSPSEGQNGIVVTVNGTPVKESAGPGEPNWTYQATLNAIVFNPNTDPPKVGAQITVQYPIGCK